MGVEGWGVREGVLMRRGERVEGWILMGVAVRSYEWGRYEGHLAGQMHGFRMLQRC